ncbi:MAG: HEAT repeat domain-containing protein [bacterium]
MTQGALRHAIGPLGLLGLMALGGSCRERPSADPVKPARPMQAARPGDLIRIVQLRVRDRTSPNDQVVRLSRKQLRQILSQALDDVGGYSLDPGGRGAGANAHALTVDVELQSLVGSEKGKASVLLTLALRRLAAAPDEPGYVRNALNEKVYALDKLQSLEVLYRDMLRVAASEMLRVIRIESSLRTAPAPRVAHAIRTSRIDTLDQGWTSRVEVWQPVLAPALLTLHGDTGLPTVLSAMLLGWSTPASGTGEGVDVREVAIKAAALRKLREAVPEILGVLTRDTRRRIRDLCLGTLAEIGDPRAVKVLTRYARQGDIQRLRKVIGVLGQIGGEEARAFLEVTADGHGDEDIQKLARETLERLVRKAPPATLPPGGRKP